MNPAGRFITLRRWGRDHQAEALQKQDGALRGASPDELATFTLAILNINITARILQAAILELAIYVDAVIQNYMLILENLVLMSVHRFTRTGRCCENSMFPGADNTGDEAGAGFPPLVRLDEATIHVTGMQAGAARQSWWEYV